MSWIPIYAWRLHHCPSGTANYRRRSHSVSHAPATPAFQVVGRALGRRSLRGFTRGPGRFLAMRAGANASETRDHPGGFRGIADFEIRGNQIYRAVTHPEGFRGIPDFEIRS
jgi:hypothetical protein